MSEKLPKQETFESIDKSILKTLAQKLERSKTKAEAAETLKRIFFFLESILNVELSSDVGNTYRSMQQAGLLLRCESISKVFESIVDKKPIHIGDQRDHYANAVVPEPEGIKIAFGEARVPGPVRLVIGFGVKPVIGFDPKNLTVSRIERQEEDPRDFGPRNFLCRHVSGDLGPEEIRFLIMRIPANIFPEDYLEETEQEKEPPFLFRAIKLLGI